MPSESSEFSELKDLLVQTLETNGALAKIQAQLRASIMVSLMDENELLRNPLHNNKVISTLQSEEGKVMFCLVKEFMEFFGLTCTMSVYDTESQLGNLYNYTNRTELIKGLGLEECSDNVPVLLSLLKDVQRKKPVNNNNNNDSVQNVSENSLNLINESKLNCTFNVQTNETLENEMSHLNGISLDK